MANTLVLNQQQVFNGLGTLTFTVPTTGLYSCLVQATVPQALITGAGGGTSRDLGSGASGGSQGIGQGSNLSLGNGGTGLGFGGSANDNATGYPSGYGAGAGGGGEGFTQGDQGTGHGGVGQGFGPGNSYQQPPTYVQTSQTTGPAVASGVSILVKQNGTTIFTAPSFSPMQSSLQFKAPINGTANDTITVVISSSTQTDEGLNGVQTTACVQQGL